MLKLQTTSQFRKDVKKLRKRNVDMELLENVIDLLLHQKTLPAHNLDHPLKGNYHGFRECHIKPDWLLIYAIDGDKLILTVSRTGTHADLF